MRVLTRALTVLALGAMAATPLAAHHGWGWATGEEFVLRGTVKKVRHGNPHGEMVLATTSGQWKVEIGQPWRNEDAGLKPAMLKPGTRLVVHGHRAAQKNQKLMKAERIVIGARNFDLYPDRPS